MPKEAPYLKYNPLVLYLSTITVIIIVFFTAWQVTSYLPHSKTIRQLFLTENSLTEGFALGFLFAALGLTIYTLLRFRTSSHYSHGWWFFPLAIALLICDETSFGKAYYNWYTTPRVCGEKFDALHDALQVIPHCLPHLGISKQSFVLAVLFLFVIILVTTISIALRCQTVILTALKQKSHWLYLTLAFILFWLGGGIEAVTEIDSLKIGSSNFLVFLEEALEMLAEYTTFFAAIAFFQHQRAGYLSPPDQPLTASNEWQSSSKKKTSI